jgi:hypothetical protein
VRLIADVDVADKLTDGLVERVKIDLQAAAVQGDRRRQSSSIASRVRLKIRAKDKHSWVIAPDLLQPAGNVGGGLGFGENNLLGLNKKILVTARSPRRFDVPRRLLRSGAAGSRFFWRSTPCSATRWSPNTIRRPPTRRGAGATDHGP